MQFLKNFFSSIKKLFLSDEKTYVNSRMLFRFFILCVLIFIICFGIAFVIFLRSSPTCQLPNVLHKDILTATRLLQQQKLRLHYLTKNHSSIPRYQIISQNPAPGTKVKSGRFITLTVSTGKKVKNMPDYIGKPFTEAKIDLISRFAQAENPPRILKAMKYSSEYEKGIVIDQNPAPKQSIDYNSEIYLIVSRGLTESMYKVPSFRLENFKEVEAALAEKGIKTVKKLKATDRKEHIGKIFQQSVKPGTELTKGDTIEFIVGVADTEEHKGLRKEIWRVFSFTVPPLRKGNSSRQYRRLKLIVKDKLGRQKRLDELVAVNRQVNLPYKTYGSGVVEVYLDGKKKRTFTFR
ncbi:MAG TPA: PASTA domain-containing protein [Spirochaetota bacterium]|nr:PASTA domain-containing protein [Spirochaetota bacterium]